MNFSFTTESTAEEVTLAVFGCHHSPYFLTSFKITSIVVDT